MSEVARSEIVVRKVDFDFPEDVELYAVPGMPRISLFIAAFSLTMPYLEPYLIRMMLKAMDHVDDENLKEDMRRFSQQEGNHFRNHARLNKIIRSKFEPDVAAEIEQIEMDLKADYERLLKDESLALNLAYAEGFEAMTCAAAMAGAEKKVRPNTASGWDELLDWHAVEEIEHRTVAFNVFEHVVGSYTYRLTRGLWAQYHYLKFIHRFYVVMLRAKGFKVMPYIPFFLLAGGFRYLNSLTPWYNPANYKIGPNLQARLDKYSEMVAAEHA